MNAGSWVAKRRPATFEPVHDRRGTGPRFERFAAAMRATPPPSAQVLDPEPDAAPAGPRPEAPRHPEPTRPVAVPDPNIEPGHAAAEPAPASLKPKPVHLGPQPVDSPVFDVQRTINTRQAADEPVTLARASAPPEAPVESTVIPRRVVTDDAAQSRVPWLGIVSWLLLCGALFASLLGWPHQTVLDRVVGLWSGEQASMLVGRPVLEQPTPVEPAPMPSREQDWSAMGPATANQTLPPTELAPPIRTPSTQSETVERAPGGPPLPQFKPRVDRLAAEFSNAFFEMGERLQQEGDFEAAVHMRHQGSNLAPWKSAGASDL